MLLVISHKTGVYIQWETCKSIQTAQNTSNKIDLKSPGQGLLLVADICTKRRVLMLMYYIYSTLVVKGRNIYAWEIITDISSKGRGYAWNTVYTTCVNSTLILNICRLDWSMDYHNTKRHRNSELLLV